MQRITTTKTVDLAQLMDELIAGVPGFSREINQQKAPDMGQVFGGGTTTTVVFADDILVADIQAVVDAHTPQVRTPRDFSAELDAITDTDGVKVWLRAFLGVRR